MALNAFDYTVCVAFLLVILVIGRRSHENRSQSLPPGPPPKPFIGNYLDVPKKEAWKKYSQWKELYGQSKSAMPLKAHSMVQTGNLVYVNILGNKILVLNDMESMRELLEKRSQKYSDRPSFVMAKYMGIENVSTCGARTLYG